MNKMAEGLREAKIENGEPREGKSETLGLEPPIKTETTDANSLATSTIKAEPQSPSADGDNPKDEKMEETEQEVGGEITLKMEPGEPPKLARTSSHKVPARTAPLFDHLPDATAEAVSTFQVISSCTYSPKSLGDTEHAMECDCVEEWGKCSFQILS